MVECLLVYSVVVLVSPVLVCVLVAFSVSMVVCNCLSSWLFDCFLCGVGVRVCVRVCVYVCMCVCV